MMYLFSDGVAELMLGLFMFCYASAVSLLTRLPKDWGYGWGGFAGPILLGLCGFGVARGVKLLRERVTAPRGGYVSLKDSPHQRITSICACLLMLGLMRLTADSHLEALMLCAFFSCYYVLSGLIYRLPYMLWLAAPSALLGIWIALKGSDLLFVMLWQGALLAVTGGVKLWRFVRAHPIPATEP